MNMITIFHTGNLHMREIAENDLGRFEEQGWRKVEKYEMLSVYSPALNEYKTVLRSDADTWANRGYMIEPTTVYHPEEGVKTVGKDEAEHLLKSGWFDTPAKFSEADKDAIVEKAVKAAKAK